MQKVSLDQMEKDYQNLVCSKSSSPVNFNTLHSYSPVQEIPRFNTDEDYKYNSNNLKSKEF